MGPDILNRRQLLQLLGASSATTLFGAEKRWSRGDNHLARLETFFNETDVRPEFVWQNREDLFYHDMKYPAEVEAAPEFAVFLNKTWVFNRSMQWTRDAGLILCHETGGELPLTGERQASAWHTGGHNEVRQSGEHTIFSKRSPRRRDCAVLPAFQFHLGQHPRLRLEVAEANADWQFCVSIKGRGGPPLVTTPWYSGAARATIDLAAELAQRGFSWNYPELHFAIGVWHETADRPASLRFKLALEAAPAVVAALPVIRTAKQAAGGIPIAAVVVDAQGNRLSKPAVRVRAEVGGRSVPLEESQGIWKGSVPNLAIGDHPITVVTDGQVQASTQTLARVTDGRFHAYNRDLGWIERDGKPAGPLTGSYQGTFFFRNAGQPGERLVQGQSQWDAWDRRQPDSEHMHFWEAVSESELDERFRFIKQSGFDLVTLHSHWGCWERLDAGGRIAPHAAEQLAMYLRMAGRHGLAHIQALSSGPYGRADQPVDYGGTVPYSRYLEAGFETKDFATPNPRFDNLYHQYLRDFTALFSQETALLAMTASGEGDHFNGPVRTNDTMRVVQSGDPNHLMFAETVLMLKKLPQEYNNGFEQSLFSGRTYFIGNNALPEFDLGVYFKMLRMARMYLAEGSWSTMPSYVRFHQEVLRDENGSRACWTGTEHYRVRLRDTLYLALVHLLPISNTWDEQIAEDEHRLVREIRSHVNWAQRFAEPDIAIRVDDDCADVDNPLALNLSHYDRAFARLGLTYRFVASEDKAPAGARLVLDGRQDAAGLVIPEELRRSAPVMPSPGYSSAFARSTDGRTILAYLYNTTRHQREYYWLGGNYHRVPRPVPFQMRLGNTPASGTVRFYDLNAKQLVSEQRLSPGGSFDMGTTEHDFFLLITPESL